MPTPTKRSNFFESELGMQIRLTLQQMVKDDKFNTGSGYSANSDLYPDNLIPFVDKHMNYLNSHPKLDSTKYLSNLRLMTRISLKRV
jgi:hypothetical protein